MRGPASAAALALLCAASCTCGKRRDTPSQDAAAPPASATAAALAADADAAADSPAAAAPPDRDPLPDPAYEAFEKALRAACDKDTGAMTTHELVLAAIDINGCFDSAVRKRLSALPPAVRRVWTRDPPDKLRALSWSPRFSRFEDACCALDDAAQFVIDKSRAAGSMRNITSAACRGGHLPEIAYLLQLQRAGDVAAFVRRIRALEPPGRARAAALAAFPAAAERLARAAPEDSVHDDECWSCTLADADWERLAMDARVADEDSRALAAILCEAWPALEGELGGPADCREAARVYFLSMLESPPAVPREAFTYPGLPPAKDDDYRRVMGPVIAACRREEDVHYTSDPIEQGVLSCLRKDMDAALAGAPADPAGKTARKDLRAAFERFTGRLCGLESATNKASLDLTPRHDRWFGSDFIKEIQCPGLAAIRFAFLARSLRDGAVTPFARHVAWREPWGERVRRGIHVIDGIAGKADCPESGEGEPWTGACRARALKPDAWRALRKDLAALPGDAAGAAKAMCDAWPALAAELGGAEACARRMTGYFLSYSSYVGIAASLE